jgi:hypothetical protein
VRAVTSVAFKKGVDQEQPAHNSKRKKSVAKSKVYKYSNKALATDDIIELVFIGTPVLTYASALFNRCYQ